MSRGKSYTFSEGPKREKAVLNRGSFTFSRSRFFHHCYSTNEGSICLASHLGIAINERPIIFPILSPSLFISPVFMVLLSQQARTGALKGRLRS
uniref:Uncharacterized protein n=1 Tax=Vitis vinifera TaxID=29760 RepID=F6HY03_VITVI